MDTTHTPGPWEYIASNRHHGAYVSGPFGGDVCDCYVMSDPTAPSVRNGGTSRPIPLQADRMDANARLIASAPELLEALSDLVAIIDAANLHNLARGVELGQTSWYVKASDRLEWARKVIETATTLPERAAEPAQA